MAENSVEKPAQKTRNKTAGFLGKIILFIKQVIGELKKVVYPTKNELWTYFWVVITFVSMIIIFVGVVDLGFNQLIKLVFG